jgi:TadE-like protein
VGVVAKAVPRRARGGQFNSQLDSVDIGDGGPQACEGKKLRACGDSRGRGRGAPTVGRARGTNRGERGVVAVEFALIVPLLALLVFGLIQFGTIYNDYISVRQGTREAARQGSVANFGPTATTGSPCYLTLSTTPSPDIQNLMCLTKSQLGLGGQATRVDVLIAKPDFSGTDTSWTVGDNLVVCAQFAEHTQTSMMSQLIGSPFLKSKTEIRIEQPSTGAETAGSESAPAGSDWSWCTV